MYLYLYCTILIVDGCTEYLIRFEKERPNLNSAWAEGDLYFTYLNILGITSRIS